MSDSNPFSPPSDPFGELPETERVHSHVGVFQDDGMLVLARSGFQLPAVCFKSGEPTTDHYELNEKALPSSKKVGIAVVGGVIGLAIAKSLWGEQFSISIPMRSDWNDVAEVKSKRGWMVSGVGLAMIILGIALSLVTDFGFILCGLGLVVGIVGLVLGGARLSKDPFNVVNFDERYIWIRGADKTVTRMFERVRKELSDAISQAIRINGQAKGLREQG